MSSPNRQNISEYHLYYHQEMANRTARIAMQTYAAGTSEPSMIGQYRPRPYDIDTSWSGYGDYPLSQSFSSPRITQSLRSDGSDHLQTPTSTTFTLDSSISFQPSQHVGVSVAETPTFAPTYVYQQADWRPDSGDCSQHSHQSFAQPIKPLAQVSKVNNSPYGLPPWATANNNIPYHSQQRQILPSSANRFTSQPIVHSQSTSPQPPTPYISTISLPPPNLPGVSIGIGLPSNMMVPASTFDSPYQQRATIQPNFEPRMFSYPPESISSRPREYLMPSSSSTDNDQLQSLAGGSSSYSSSFGKPDGAYMEAMHMYKSDKGVIRTAQPADILPARSDVELNHDISSTHLHTPFTRESSAISPPPSPQTAAPAGYVDLPLHQVDIGRSGRSSTRPSKQGRKRYAAKAGDVVAEWESVLDKKERRKTQNRLAQRAFRARTKVAEANSGHLSWSTDIPQSAIPARN